MKLSFLYDLGVFSSNVEPRPLKNVIFHGHRRELMLHNCRREETSGKITDLCPSSSTDVSTVFPQLRIINLLEMICSYILVQTWEITTCLHFLLWEELYALKIYEWPAFTVLTRGAGSNWRMTCCKKTSRWVGLSFRCSMLLKHVHWSSDA